LGWPERATLLGGGRLTAAAKREVHPGGRVPLCPGDLLVFDNLALAARNPTGGPIKSVRQETEKPRCAGLIEWAVEESNLQPWD
jgi:hypothetical protein